MKTVQEWLVLVILFCDVHSYPDLRCPYPSERRFRSRWVCNGVSTEKYTCLYNAIKKTHEESCKFKPVISGEGNEYHISVYPDPVSCQNLQRYQPFRLRSNMSSECVFLKSTCSDEGQYLFYHGSSTNDHRCGCDFQKGFGFVHKVERQCDCFPSKEDCSCYMKKNKCLPGFKLSSDYTCIHEDNKTHISKCPGIGPDRARNDTQHCRLYSKNKTDHNGARIFKLVASILTVICIIYVICVFALLLTNKVPKCLIQVISPPFNLKACQEGCFVKLSWSKKPEKSPTNRIQEFKIYYTHNDNWDGHQHEMVAADILHYYFSKLLPTKTYRFKVAACLNNLVESKCSEEETFVTRLPVEPPYFNAYKHNVEDNGNSCSVLLKWSAPGDTLIDIDNYSIRFTTNNWETCEEKLLPWDIYEYVIQNAQQHAHYLFEIVSISNEVCSIPLKRIYSTKHDTYQCGAEFDVGYMNASMDRFKAEVHKLFTDKFNGIPGVQTLQETLLSKGSIILEFTFTSEGFDDEKVLHDTLKNAFKAGVIGPWEINLKKFWFKRLHDPQPPEHVTASSINDGVLVSWTVPPSTIFNTKEYIVEFSRNNWISKEEIYVSADKNKYFISKVLPSTTLYVKVYTCICHSIRSSPSREVRQFVGGPTPPEKIEVTAIEDTLKVSWIEPRHPVLEFVKDYKILIEEGDNIICETVRKDKSPFLKQYCQPFTNYKVRIVTCTVNGVESEPSQVVETKTKDFSKTEKENFLRLSGLLRNIAYRVVKERFDKVYPASDRGKLFEQNKHTLKSHLTEDQINQFLEQTNEGNFENMNFDMHQLLVLFLCLKGWQFTKKHRNKSPTDEDSSEISDLNRIETCLTHLEERNDNKISSKKFESLWNDVSPAIIRLGGDKYKSWCEGLRVNQTLKQENQETYKVDEISQSSSTEIDKLNRENLTEINQKYLEQVKERQNKQEENMEYLNQTQKSLQTEVETIKKDNASLNVCPDSHQIMIKRWKEDNERFKEIKVVSEIVSVLSDGNNCITITGIPGIGKTATLHHVALCLNETKQYTIVPCINPNDIKNYYKQGLLQVFVLDDICGKYFVNLTKVDKLLDSEECIKDILREGKSKVMSSCRLQIFQEPEVKQLDFITGRVFDMSNEYQHTVQEKLQIAHEYLASGVIEQIEKNIFTYSCFPLKCKLFEERGQDDPLKFFKNHFDVYTDELDKLEKLTDKSKYCALFLTVVFNGCIDAKTLVEEAPDEFTSHTDTQVKSICAKFRVDAVSKIETKLESLLNVYLKKNNNSFLVIHDTMFDFLCSYFGRKSQREFIQFADIRVLQERALFKSLSQSKLTEKDDFTVDIAEENKFLYFNRLINEMKKGQVQAVFYNIQMKLPNFRQMMIQAFNKKDKSFLQQLLVTKDHDTSCKIYGVNCYTPLSLASYLGYDDVIKFMMPFIDKKYLELFDAIKLSCVAGHPQVFELLIEKYKEVDCSGKKSNDFNILKHTYLSKTEFTPLMAASQSNQVEIMNMLLTSGADVNTEDCCKDVSPLKKASNLGHENAVKTLIEKGANPDIADQQGWTPLKSACKQGHLAVVAFLIMCKANIDKPDQDGWTPLKIASLSGHTKIVQLLLDNNAKIDQADNAGWTSLMSACQGGHTNIVLMLIQKGANINHFSSDGYTPISIACKHENTDVLRLLISHGANVETADNKGLTPLRIACDQVHVNIVKMLINAGADVNHVDINNISPLNVACKYGEYTIVESLINGKASIDLSDNQGNTPLLRACEFGHLNIVQLLIKMDCDLLHANNMGWTPLLVAVRQKYGDIINLLQMQGASFGKGDLFVACEKGHIQIVKLLIDKGFDINAEGEDGLCPFMFALQNQQFEIVDYLIEMGAEFKLTHEKWISLISVFNSDGSTLLTKACSTGYQHIARLIIQQTNDFNKRDQNGWSPITSACYGGHKTIVQHLLDNGVYLNETDGNMQTPFLVALERNQVHIITFLICMGLDLNVLNEIDDNGCTPLINTCHRNQLPIVEILISKGVDANAVGSNNKTALEIAWEEKHWQIVNLLLKNGANVDCSKKIFSNSEDNTDILQFACQNGLKDLLLVLLKDFDINGILKNGDSLLTHSCKHGMISIVQLLCSEGASIDKHDENFRTALELACKWQHIDIIDYLIDNGARVDTLSYEGHTPLMTACLTGKFLVVKTLIKKGGDQNQLEGAESLLSAACSGKQYDVIDLLMDSGIDIKRVEHVLNDLIDRHCKEGFDLLAVSCKKGLKALTNFLISSSHYANKSKIESLKYLMCACDSGHESVVSLLISKGLEINQTDENGLTPFRLACKKGHFKIVESLIRMKVDVNKADDKGLTPLHFACMVGKENIVLSLIHAAASINSKDNNGVTPLNLACKFGYIQIVETLVRNGAAIDICDYKKWTPLMTSCQQGHKKISEFLIQTGVCVNSIDQDGWTALRIACNEGNTDIAEILIENGANMDLQDEKGWTPLKAACKRERESVVALLLRKGADIQECDQETLNPLMLVCQTDNLNILKLFLDQKINVNNPTADGKTALRIACEGGHFKIARKLIENGADVTKSDKDKLTPLHAVCARSLNKLINSIQDATWTVVYGYTSVIVNPSNLNVAAMLIECGADVNAATSEGTTALMLASSGYEPELINMLIDKGANINKVDKKGMTAISISSKASNYNIVNLLLDHGSLPDTEDNDGNTPLHFLCGHLLIHSNQNFSQLHSVLLHSRLEDGDNCLETIKLLIDKGANINHSNKFGYTPLFVASMFDNLKRIKLLIENGADISKKDNSGRTVLFAAFLSDDSEILQCLIENGANINEVDEDGISPLQYLCGVTRKKNESFTGMAKLNSILQMFIPGRTENMGNSFEEQLKHKLFLLVKNGADVNIADRKGLTSLMAACDTQKNKIVELLISMGAHVDDADNDGITALIIGCFHGYYDIVNMLLEEANVNKCSKEGDAPLHYACMEGHESIVKMLLQNNANVNHLNKKGWTPLMFACKHGYRDIVKFLLEHGADATWYSNDRWYPLKLAKKGNFKSLENLLNEYGAYMNEDDD